MKLLLWAVNISLYRLCVGEHVGETEEVNKKMSVESLQCREAALSTFLPQLKGENVFVCIGTSPLPDHRQTSQSQRESEWESEWVRLGQ